MVTTEMVEAPVVTDKTRGAVGVDLKPTIWPLLRLTPAATR